MGDILTADRSRELVDLYTKQTAYIKELREEIESIKEWADGEYVEGMHGDIHVLEQRIKAANDRKDRIINVLAGREPDSKNL